MTRPLLALLLSMALPTGSSAQGLVGSDGIEPRVSMASGDVGTTRPLRVEGLVHSTTPSLWIGVGTSPAHLPIAQGSAAFGLDPGHPGFQLLGPLQVPVGGAIELFLKVPSQLAGQSFYLQAINLDPLAPQLGIELSDTIIVSFGTSDDHTIMARKLSSGRLELIRVFADGQTIAPTLPPLHEITLLPPQLSSTVDTAPLSAERALVVNSVPSRPHLRLPSGARLFHYRRQNGAEGLFLISEDGRDYRLLVEVPCSLKPMIAVSRFDPLIAVISDCALPQFGGTQLLLVRVDGMNIPGTASCVHASQGLVQGIDLEESSLAFLDGALLATDGQSVVRVPTRPIAAASSLSIPTTGGLVPQEVDEEFALSLDGTAAVFTAGLSDTHRDVYRVGISGPALNLTLWHGEYENVSYGDLHEGLRLALAPDASQVAFVRRFGGEKELFVQATIPGAPRVQLTGNNLFVGTIDIEGGLMFYDPTRLVFHAGTTGFDHDLYEATVSLGSATITNLSGSSGILNPPFGLGALELRLVGRTAFGGLFMMGAAGPSGLQLSRFGSTLNTGTLRSGFSALRKTQPSAGGTLLHLETSNGDELLHLSASGESTTLLAPGAGLQVAGLFSSGSGLQSIVSVAGGPQPVVFGVTEQGSLQLLPFLPNANIDDAIFNSARIVLTSDFDGTLTLVHRIDLDVPSVSLAITLPGEATLL